MVLLSPTTWTGRVARHDSQRGLAQPRLVISTRNWRHVCRGSAGNEENIPAPDIDQLARLLSQQAAQMRTSMDADELDELMSDQGLASGASSGLAGSMPIEGKLAKIDLEIIVEEGGFVPEDFLILQSLGQLTFQAPAGSPDQQGGAVLVYSARYNTRLPYQYPVPVLMKEYLGPAKSIGGNELRIMKQLYGSLPGDKWQAATAPVSPLVPVVPLLGPLMAPASDDAYQLMGGDEDTLWLVYKWEGLRPLDLFMAQGPPVVKPGLLPWGKRPQMASRALAARHRMLRVISKGTLLAMGYCHSKGVVHGSISSGCVLLSTTDDDKWDKLQVKLDNLGFGQCYPGGEAGEGAELDTLQREGMRQDRQALALLLAELYLSTLPSMLEQTTEGQVASASLSASSSPGDSPIPPPDVPSSGSAAVQRSSLHTLFFDVFHEDLDELRDYCCLDERYSGFVDFLDRDNRAGWDFLSGLIRGEKDCEEVLYSRFLAGIS